MTDGSDTEGQAFYDQTYGRFADDLYASIRRAAFGEEIGQNSWTTADEYRAFFRRLELRQHADVLEIASGSGGPALFMAAETSCRVVGMDLHEAGVRAANAAAESRRLADRARFVVGDARERLPFDDGSFDVVICIDSVNHLYERAKVLSEWHRVLRAGGVILFTNPITVTGIVTREEAIVRSGGMGEFVFTAPGVDERLVAESGFVDIRSEDVTESMERVASAWHAARAAAGRELDRIEGASANETFQRFLEVVATLARERRLSRIAYRARKPLA